ncbi:MAG: SMC-Scp complex subunit ScpB [Spirochaetales bacterium]|nr:SMC-Scp complex subunit ScpB [Spirochaetales bacterium]
MELHKEQALIEAVLFLESDPVNINSLAKISDLPVDVVKPALEGLKEKYTRVENGIELIELAGGYLLTPKEILWDFLKSRYGKKNESRLSKAALETLSIVAYSQPITKGEIENIRGVSADGMLKVLQDKNFIKVVGKKEAPGKPVQFGTTKEFLKTFRLSSIADLPKLDERNTERFELNG